MRIQIIRPGIAALAVAAGLLVTLDAQQKPPVVTSAQLLAGTANQSQWLMFGGDYTSRRHSPLRLTSAPVTCHSFAASII